MKKGISEAQKRASQKWDNEHLKRLSLAMLMEDYDAMEKHIEITKESRNRFINRAIRNTITTDISEGIHKME